MENGYCVDEDYLPNRSTATQLLMAWKKGQKYLNLFWKGVFAKPSRKLAYSSQEFKAFDIQSSKDSVD